ncbi:hypothetical protein MHU86_16967 [Fragilaria crotonensis]|nr:hypothetical protein MHU86_16967 [Fragilaria crotonensis]
MSSAKYDMRINPVYQVDFSASTKGKRFSLSKRKVRFSYGFSNAEALAQGLKGIHCRGEEHEVNLIWSLTSGKRVVTADGAEVHFSRGKRTEMRFECSWTTAGNHVMKLVAHATRFGRADDPTFRQFDLFLDGLSFFSMPKIFELGVVSSKEILNRGAKARMAFAAPQALERGYLPESDNHRYSAGRQYQHGDKIENGVHSDEFQHRRQTRPAPQRAQSVPLGPVPQPVAVHDLLSPTQSAGLMEQPLFSASAPVVDQFAPVQPAPATYNDVANQILNAYGPAPKAPALLALAYEPHTYRVPAAPQQQILASQTHSVAPHQTMYFASSGSVTSGTTSPTGTFFQSPIEEFSQVGTHDSPTSVRQLSELEKAMGNLVNLDDIGEPALCPLKLTMKQEKDSKKMSDGKSRPIPPVTSWNVGSQAPLAAIKATTQRATPAREVMRANVNQASHGSMLVVYGTSPKEAPPLQPVYHPYGRASFAH